MYTRKKPYGFINKPNSFDCIVNMDDKKLFSKVYEHLSTLKMADDQVKEPMSLWPQNIGSQISLAKWQCLWKTFKSFRSME